MVIEEFNIFLIPATTAHILAPEAGMSGSETLTGLKREIDGILEQVARLRVRFGMERYS